MDEKGRFEFNSFERSDGLIEETAIEVGSEGNPDRHAIGMKLFRNEAEKAEWIKVQIDRKGWMESEEVGGTQKESERSSERSERAANITRSVLARKIESLLDEHGGDRDALESSVRTFLSAELIPPEETFTLKISDDARSISARIHLPWLGEFSEIKIDL